MPTPSFFPTLLTRSVQNGWVTPSLAKKAQALVQLGIHPEQALIGTGLLQDVQYGELLQELGGLAFLRVTDRNRISYANDAASSCVILVDEPRRMVFGFSDPMDRQARAWAEQEAEGRGRDFEGFMVLWSDVRPASSEDRSAASFWREIRSQTSPEWTHVRLQPGGTDVHVLNGFEARSAQAGSVPFSAMPALHERLSRRSRHHGWHADSMAFGWRQGMQLIRASGKGSVHPTSWMHAWQRFHDQPEGLLLLIHPDPYAGRFVRDQLPERQATSSSGGPRFADARSEGGKEEVLHLALQEEPIAAVSDSTDWLSPLRAAGIPVKVIEATHTPKGTAWMVYSL